MRRPARELLAFPLAFVLSAIPVGSQGQTPPTKPEGETLQAIETDYKSAARELDLRRIQRLSALAARQKGSEADLTYLTLFRSAIGGDFYKEAEPAAERIVSEGSTNQEVEFLAHLVNVLSEADRGEYEASFQSLNHYMDRLASNPATRPNLQARTVLTLSEAYYRRLLRGRRFDIARRLCDLVEARAVSPSVKAHFAASRNRLELVGQPAPPIIGKDLDGKPVSTADLKGKVVLVVFWASWAPPCGDEAPILNASLDAFGPKGFAIVGVNLDGVGGATPTSRDPAEALAAARRFALTYTEAWPSVVNGSGGADFVKAYRITAIPANVLIDQSGQVVHPALPASEVREAVAKLLAPAR